MAKSGRKYNLDMSLHNSSDACKYSETNINAQKHIIAEQKIDTLAEEGISTTSRMGKNTNVATENAGKTVKSSTRQIPWLRFLTVFCTEVSVIGLRYVVKVSSSAFRRSVWLLLVLAGTAFTTYHIQNRIAYYFTHPVNVVIRDEHMEEIIFPTVTICSENRISLSKTDSVGESISSTCYSFDCL